MSRLLDKLSQVVTVPPDLRCSSWRPQLKEMASDTPVPTAVNIQTRTNRSHQMTALLRKRGRDTLQAVAAQAWPERVSAPTEEHPAQNEGSSEWPTVPELEA